MLLLLLSCVHLALSAPVTSPEMMIQGWWMIRNIEPHARPYRIEAKPASHRYIYKPEALNKISITYAEAGKNFELVNELPLQEPVELNEAVEWHKPVEISDQIEEMAYLDDKDMSCLSTYMLNARRKIDAAGLDYAIVDLIITKHATADDPLFQVGEVLYQFVLRNERSDAEALVVYGAYTGLLRVIKLG